MTSMTPAQIWNNFVKQASHSATVFGQGGYEGISIMVPEDKSSLTLIVAGQSNVEAAMPAIEQFKKTLEASGSTSTEEEIVLGTAEVDKLDASAN